MLAQSTSTSTEGARRTTRSKFATTSNQADSCDEKYRWRNQMRLKMVDPSARDRRDGEQERDSQRAAAAGDGKDAESNARESRADTMRAPPLISSTKGTKKKSNARAISSWTIEKRRSPITLDDFSFSFIDHAFSR